MGLLALCSAKGSPGVSTLAVGLAGLWPRPVTLVDADPAGGDLIWRYRSADAGDPLDPDRGLVSMGAAVRRVSGPTALAAHTQVLSGGLPVVVGVTHPGQVTGLGPVWPLLADAFADSVTDVIADCGRVIPGSPTVPLLARADAVVFVVRSATDAFAQLRERLRGLADPLRLDGSGSRSGRPRTSVLLITDDRDRHGAKDLQRLLDGEQFGVPVRGRVAWDPRGAKVLSGDASGGGFGGHGRSLVVRSLRELIPRLEEAVRSPAVA
ncbi:MAG: hypothetical protein ACRC35_04315 [Angustibacter sp.]